MTKRGSDDDWFEVSDRDWMPSFKPKQLKLLADAQVPQPIVNEIGSAGIAIATLSKQQRNASDATVLQTAQRSGRVLLTLDEDFWNDRKHPLQAVQQGVIFVHEPPGDYDRVLQAFGLVYGSFARSYPLDWWSHMKVRAVVGEFEVKMRTWEGKVAKYKMKLRRGRVVAREA